MADAEDLMIRRISDVALIQAPMYVNSDGGTEDQQRLDEVTSVALRRRAVAGTGDEVIAEVEDLQTP